MSCADRKNCKGCKINAAAQRDHTCLLGDPYGVSDDEESIGETIRADSPRSSEDSTASSELLDFIVMDEESEEGELEDENVCEEEEHEEMCRLKMRVTYLETLVEQLNERINFISQAMFS